MTTRNTTQETQAVSEAPALTVVQGVSLIFGTNIGAGILSLPYAARHGGFLALCLALIIAGVLTTFSMMYVAEVSGRTREPLQLSGLAQKYLGNWGKWLVFVAIMINSVGALVAYAAGSGTLLANLLHIPELLGTLLFFALGSFVMWKGLHATGFLEGVITCGMAAIIIILSAWTLLGPGIDLSNLLVFHPFYVVPIMNLAVFTFMAQYVVPELVRGMDPAQKKAIPQSIIAGMSITGFTLALVPFVALGLLGTDVSEVVTLSWGESLGSAAFYLANIFALCAMFTSFIAIGYTAMRNVLDTFHWHHSGLQRVYALVVTVVPPLVISLAGLGGFADALGYAGGFSGLIMSVVPVLLLHAARRTGEVEPLWQVSWQGHRSVQVVLIVVYVAAFGYSLASLFHILPSGWA
ncbi:amino acid permease [Corynebacterium sp. sy017]|uniref:aromatic amino acid transport family protein n=1 Tax=unclassified Corynebacterium TaxID=2624378 RepID=UPI0011858AA9|nr:MULTISPECIES: amino acid permease [unclassified Corynebacterium]MBP3089277.1 amino acid permease [Corynebacterium sp. sy017]QDZ43218.1 amino acid permease [Corynebacterium sp. sy039]TSD91018.1 amino acid permease [Corynebacterium sp. SY003]